jgi:hypothetical protein
MFGKALPTASSIAPDRVVASSACLASPRALALASAILAATSGTAPADPFRIQPAATADQGRAGRFETLPVRQAPSGPRYGGGFIEFLLSGGGGGGGTGVASPAQAAYAPMLLATDPSRAPVDPRNPHAGIFAGTTAR